MKISTLVDLTIISFPGYSPSFQFANPAPIVIGWASPEDLDNGFVAPSAFADPDIICHKGATPGQTHAQVVAGESIDLQWTVWPESHKGPVLDYLANCNGPCESVDKTTLEFFKIDAGGLIDGTAAPGTWASDQLISNNNTWTVKIPSDIAPGNYVLRHEIIALHAAGSLDGAQNYPQCINVAITGSGTATPAGILGTALYKDTDPGILIGIYTPLSTYVIPGPAVYVPGAVTGATATTATIASAVSTVPTTLGATSTAAELNTKPTGLLTDVSYVLETLTTSSSIVVLSPTAIFSNSTISRVAGRSSSTTTRHPASIFRAKTHATHPTYALTRPVLSFPTTKAVPVMTSTTSSTISSTASVTILDVSASLTTASISAASSTLLPTTAAIPKMPAGVTFKVLMGWIESIVNQIAGGNTALLGRRHARDLGA